MPTATKALLIVDDDPSLRTSLSFLFTELGYEVRSAEDGFSALEEVRQLEPDLILSDLNMPGMSGFEFLSVVRRRFPHLCTIAMSGAFSGENAQPDVAADAFYEKASNLGKLLSTVSVMSHNPSMTERPKRSLPIWMASNGRNTDGLSYLTMSCPECLRAFLHVMQPEKAPTYQATCTHCESVLEYAVVEASDPSLPQAFQRKQA
jgi:CheY-like chemotaxis protein